MGRTARSGHDGVERVRRALRESSEPNHRAIVDAEVVWFGTKDRGRVDARLRDRSGREHHVVAHDDGRDVTVRLVLGEPDQVDPRTPVVVVVNGPSGSGKSSLLRAIARLDVRPWVLFDEPILGRTDQRLLVWPHRAPHLHAGFLRGIAAVAAAGNAVALSAGGHPQQVVRECFAALEVLHVGLDCPLHALLARERRRDDRWAGLAEQTSAAHDGWSYDLRIDTGSTGSTEAADLVLAQLGFTGSTS